MSPPTQSAANVDARDELINPPDILVQKQPEDAEWVICKGPSTGGCVVLGRRKNPCILFFLSVLWRVRSSPLGLESKLDI
jgi:hypothetical protein